ncbi:hypothetical protein [Streptomyces sp. NPDC001604]|uniref:hypothetical protein n=1 Tax=Streptomyces sp. NPDC001604 TaxID=3364593 RepID=UPI0036C2A7BD
MDTTEPVSDDRRPPRGSGRAREALQVAAGAVAIDDADVFAGPGVHPAGQVLGEHGGEEYRRQHDVDGDAVSGGDQPGEQADGGVPVRRALDMRIHSLPHF